MRLHLSHLSECNKGLNHTLLGDECKYCFFYLFGKDNEIGSALPPVFLKCNRFSMTIF